MKTEMQSTGCEGDITDWLRAWCAGDGASGEAAMHALYDTLHGLAGRYLRAERVGHTLQPTALVNEAYVRLLEQRTSGWRNREHFMACAAQAMRRILVDHARRCKMQKRGGAWQRVDLSSARQLALERPADLLALDDALSELARLDPRKSRIVELRFFAGLSIDEVARCLDCSRPTVVRAWRMARLWLYRQLSISDTGPAS